MTDLNVLDAKLAKYLEDNKIDGFDTPVEQVSALRFYLKDTTTTIKGHVCKQYYHMGAFIRAAQKQKTTVKAKKAFVELFGDQSKNDYSAFGVLYDKAIDANELVTWYKAHDMRSLNPSRIKETFMKRNESDAKEKTDLEKTKANIDNMLKQLQTACKRIDGSEKAKFTRLEGDDRETAMNYLMAQLSIFNTEVLPKRDSEEEMEKAA